MKKIIITAILPLSLFAQLSNSQRITNAYQESFKNKDLECVIFQAKTYKAVVPNSMTTLKNEALSRSFLLKTDAQQRDFTFGISNQNGYHEYVFEMDSLRMRGTIQNKDFFRLAEYGTKGFFLSSSDIVSDPDNLFSSLNLKKMKCNAEFAKSKPIVLTGEHHINVHPHDIYDYRRLTTQKVSSYFSSMDSYVLVDGYNRQGGYIDFVKFLKSGAYTLSYRSVNTSMSIPQEIPFVVSPAGYNDYTLPLNGEVNIYLTGGNHNFCIWNNTRNLMWSLFYSESEAVLNINYDPAATVVQKDGIIPGTSFKKRTLKRNGNLLSTLFSINNSKRISYHKSYNYYFMNDFIKRFTGLYKTLEYTYKDKDFEKSIVIQGQGKRSLKINLNYL